MQLVLIVGLYYNVCLFELLLGAHQTTSYLYSLSTDSVVLDLVFYILAAMSCSGFPLYPP